MIKHLFHNYKTIITHKISQNTLCIDSQQFTQFNDIRNDERFICQKCTLNISFIPLHDSKTYMVKEN